LRTPSLPRPSLSDEAKVILGVFGALLAVVAWVLVYLKVMETSNQRGMQIVVTFAGIIGVSTGVGMALFMHEEDLTRIYWHDIQNLGIGDIWANREAVKQSDWIHGRPTVKQSNTGHPAHSVNGMVLDDELVDTGYLPTSTSNGVDLKGVEDESFVGRFAAAWRDWDSTDAWEVETFVPLWVRRQEKMLPKAKAYPVAMADAQTAHTEGYDAGVRDTVRDYAERTRGEGHADTIKEHRERMEDFTEKARGGFDDERNDDADAAANGHSSTNGDVEDDDTVTVEMDNDEFAESFGGER
jgi:hypothetical protein